MIQNVFVFREIFIGMLFMTITEICSYIKSYYARLHYVLLPISMLMQAI